MEQSKEKLVKLSKYSKVMIDNRKKNTKRKITKELFDACLYRDGGCVICKTTQNLDKPHHVLFGLEQNLGETRNEMAQLVTICRNCHHKLHFEGGNNYRELCKQYLGL